MAEENNKKIILSLCGGTGSWEKPYKDAGYDTRNITLPDYDIFKAQFLSNDIIFPKEMDNGCDSGIIIPKEKVYGILSAPPCTMFSLARTKANMPRDLKEGMECVRACLEIIWSCMEIRQDTKIKTLTEC